MSSWGLRMSSKSAAVHFNCPHCNALYQIIKVEAGPETISDRWVTCRNCARALPAREGNSVIKYFLFGKRPGLIHGRVNGNVDELSRE